MSPLYSKKERVSGILVIAASFLMIFVCMGFCSSNRSMYVAAITQALDIKRSVFSFNDTCRYVTSSLINLYFGRLIMKFGVKKLVGAGFVSLTVASLLYALGTNVIAFYVGSCFLGMGFSWTSTTIVSYLVNRWFPEKRGTITGLALCANGLGGALAAQIITPFIYEEGNLFGYRNAYFLVVGLLVAVGVVVTCLIREPQGKAMELPGKKKRTRGVGWSGITLKEALRKPYFYGAAICVFLTGTCLQGIIGISAVHLGDVGITPAMIATIMSAHSISLCAAKFLAGISYDKLGLRWTVVICEFFGLVSFVTLALSTGSSFGVSMAFIWSVTSSMAMPLETVMVPLIAADLFGEKEYPKIMGLMVSISTAGFAVSTPVANLVFDICGSYEPVLYATAVLMLVIILGFWLIIDASKREMRKHAEPAESGEGIEN